MKKFGKVLSRSRPKSDHPTCTSLRGMSSMQKNAPRVPRFVSVISRTLFSGPQFSRRSFSGRQPQSSSQKFFYTAKARTKEISNEARVAKPFKPFLHPAKCCWLLDCIPFFDSCSNLKLSNYQMDIESTFCRRPSHPKLWPILQVVTSTPTPIPTPEPGVPRTRRAGHTSFSH